MLLRFPHAQRFCLPPFPPRKNTGCPILRAFCEGWDVHPPPATELPLVPLPQPFWFSSPKGICFCVYSLPSPKQNGCPILRAFFEAWDLHPPPSTKLPLMPLPQPFCSS